MSRNFETGRIQEVLPLWVGEHDFRGFAGRVMGKENTLKTIYQAKMTQNDDRFTLTFTGTGFLYRMVRMLVGSLVMLAYGKIDKTFLKQRLQLQNLSFPIITAPARGLFLENIDYEDGVE